MDHEADTPESITFLPGEMLLYKDKNATHIHAMGQAAGTVYITNFRVVFDPESKVRYDQLMLHLAHREQKTPAADGLVRYKNLQIVEAASCEVPLTMIVNIRKKSSKIDLWCKDLQIVKFRFPPNTKCLTQFNDALIKAQPATVDKLFAFAMPSRSADQVHYWDLYSVMSEMKVCSVDVCQLSRLLTPPW